MAASAALEVALSAMVSWLILVAAGGTALAVDLVLASRHRRQRLRNAVVATIGWTVAGVAFAGAIAGLAGGGDAGRYLTVFLLEKSLSIDNVAVFAVVLSAFAVEGEARQRVLSGGILLALLLRLGLIAGGLAVVSKLHGALVGFGVILLIAGVRMVLAKDDPARPPRLVSWLRRRRVPTAAAALVALAVADLVFAVDSVPAAFAVTREPFVIVAANVFAVLGLRPMFDLLIVALERLEQLAKALGALLGLIGVALCLEPVWTVPEWVLLLAVFGCLGGGVLASLTCPREPTDAVAGRSQ